VNGRKVEMQLDTGKVVGQGVLFGLIGYATVAVVFAIANVIDGRSPFFTAAAPGSVFFDGATDPESIVVSMRTVAEFNGVHLLSFLAFGLIGAWLAMLASKGAQRLYPTLFFWIFVAFHMIGAVQMFVFPMNSVIPAIAVWAGGILASLVMAGYLLRVNPRIMRKQAW